jgi:hypothetical protein
VTTQDLGSIGEVVGALATVATLIYLALQIRANTRATRAETRRTNQVDQLGSYSEIIASEEVASIFEKGLADLESLTSTERLRFDFLFSRIMGAAQNLFQDQSDGYESSERLERHLLAVIPMLRSPGGLKYWSNRKAIYDPEFRRRLDQGLGSSSGASSHEPPA